jgi:hypothetical protein
MSTILYFFLNSITRLEPECRLAGSRQSTSVSAECEKPRWIAPNLHSRFIDEPLSFLHGRRIGQKLVCIDNGVALMVAFLCTFRSTDTLPFSLVLRLQLP